jgi:hypothetical protein
LFALHLVEDLNLNIFYVWICLVVSNHPNDQEIEIWLVADTPIPVLVISQFEPIFSRQFMSTYMDRSWIIVEFWCLQHVCSPLFFRMVEVVGWTQLRQLFHVIFKQTSIVHLLSLIEIT